jgi:hypothetical protein
VLFFGNTDRTKRVGMSSGALECPRRPLDKIVHPAHVLYRVMPRLSIELIDRGGTTSRIDVWSRDG